ncbi:MAG: exodeoxyribonuclease VII small subunit [Bradymonadales bacterium]|nr:exodeoxyribonuclease VII small subunit [Bradymonadales bacterium]
MTDTKNPETQPPERSELGYAQAVMELEKILEQLETADIDVDVLSGAVERAAWLLKYCRQRINKAEVRIKEVLADLEDQGVPESEP